MLQLRCNLIGTRSRFVKYLSAENLAFLHSNQIRNKPQEHLGTNHVEHLFPRLCGPSVKKLLSEYGIEISSVPNTGPHGTILKGDVLSYIRNKKLTMTPVTAKKSVPTGKKIIAKGKSHDDVAMPASAKDSAQQSVLSKTTIPHAYMNVECSIDKVYEYQERMKKDGYNVSLNDFIIKSAASAIRKVPEINITKKDGQARALGQINIAVTSADNTSFVINKADSLTVQLISDEKQRSGNTGNVSLRIFDLASSGISEFKAVIRPPEVSVLAIGAARCVYEDSDFRQKVRITLSFNNEVISAETAGMFVSYFKKHLENPLTVCLA